MGITEESTSQDIRERKIAKNMEVKDWKSCEKVPG